ncbi:MAG TPA: hypothetical protein VH701_11970, partial [Vicinamibacterales bacterium]
MPAAARSTIFAFFSLIAVASNPAPVAAQAAGNDLDAFMEKVLARRDDNWKKLQQYILDERARFEVRGPGRIPIWGDDREFTWYIRDGYFVRSPLRVNGVEVSESDRRAYEEKFVRQAQAREKREANSQSSDPQTPEEATPADAAADVQDLIQQTREPQFVSTAYFLRFKFEKGRYALVGRESYDGRPVLRIEYYPTRLFDNDDRKDRPGRSTDRRASNPRGQEVMRLMNKASLVTLWVEPKLHQIVKYTFDNVGLDFLPGRWLVHVDEIRAGMVRREAFPDVWRPAGLDVGASVVLASGRFDF